MSAATGQQRNGAPPPDDPAMTVEFKEVSFSYPRGRPLISGCSWAVPRGLALVVLRGSSGSGKTTILNLISGLADPSAGVVTTLGQPISELPATKRRQLRKTSIGHVFQDFRLLPELNAWENVALPLWLLGVASDEAHRRAVAALARVDLGWATDRRPGQLSGGEQQRVGLARALAPEPRLILADEPTANLDDDSARTVGRLLRAATAAGATVIVASHDVRLWTSSDLIFDVGDGGIRPVAGADR